MKELQRVPYRKLGYNILQRSVLSLIIYNLRRRRLQNIYMVKGETEASPEPSGIEYPILPKFPPISTGVVNGLGKLYTDAWLILVSHENHLILAEIISF